MLIAAAYSRALREAARKSKESANVSPALQASAKQQSQSTQTVSKTQH